MNKKFELNGIKVELSKEELQDMLKEYDKPKWEVKLDEYTSCISLYKNNEKISTLLPPGVERTGYNLTIISRDMAHTMCDLMETKDVLDGDVLGTSIYYSLCAKEWYVYRTYSDTNSKHFKTYEAALLAIKLLNESKDMKEWIERMSK